MLLRVIHHQTGFGLGDVATVGARNAVALAMDHEHHARGCGLVTVRQRPGTAKGVMFITIEDETGNVNVIIWPSLLEKQRKEALNASLLAVYSTWQCEGEVRHLVAQRLVDVSHLLGGLRTISRNFC